MSSLNTAGDLFTCGRNRVLYDSGSSAGAGAAIDSGILDVRDVSVLGVWVDLTGTTGTDALTLDLYLDQSTVFASGLAVRTVASAAKELGTIGPANAAVGTAPAIQFAMAVPLAPYVQLHLATNAAGRRLVVWANSR
jgi:hypothetical protein